MNMGTELIFSNQLFDSALSDPDLPPPKKEAALSLAKSGLAVFPCHPDSKVPAVKEWQTRATTDLGQIEQWWSDQPGYNPAIYPEASGLCVIDADEYKDGFDKAALGALGLPDTCEVGTARGGVHYYFEGRLPTTSNQLGKCIDTRGRDGFVLAPGATFEGKPYLVKSNRPVAPLPKAIAKAAEKTSREPLKVEGGAIELDLPHNIARADQLLDGYVKRGKVAVSGDAGNPATFKVFCELKDLALSREKALELMMKPGGYNDNCDPPWSQMELEKLQDNAWKYGENEPGSKALQPPSEAFKNTPAVADSALEDERPRETPNSRFEILERHEFKDRPVPQWLIKDIARDKSVHMHFGKSSTFKTFFALEIAGAVTSGKPAFGHFKVHRTGDAVIFADEDPDDVMRIRYAAYCKARGISNPFAQFSDEFKGRLAIIPRCPRIGTTGDIEAAIAELKTKGIRPAFVAIDTASKAMAGLNQDSPTDVGLLIAAMDKMRREFDCAVWIIHHPKKADENELRGSSAFMNDLDVLIHSALGNKPMEVRLEYQKFKNGAVPKPMSFQGKLYEVEGQFEDDEDGNRKQLTAPAFDYAPNTGSAATDIAMYREAIQAAGGAAKVGKPFKWNGTATSKGIDLQQDGWRVAELKEAFPDFNAKKLRKLLDQGVREGLLVYRTYSECRTPGYYPVRPSETFGGADISTGALEPVDGTNFRAITADEMGD